MAWSARQPTAPARGLSPAQGASSGRRGRGLIDIAGLEPIGLDIGGGGGGGQGSTPNQHPGGEVVDLATLSAVERRRFKKCLVVPVQRPEGFRTGGYHDTWREGTPSELTQRLQAAGGDRTEYQLAVTNNDNDDASSIISDDRAETPEYVDPDECFGLVGPGSEAKIWVDGESIASNQSQVLQAEALREEEANLKKQRVARELRLDEVRRHKNGWGNDDESPAKTASTRRQVVTVADSSEEEDDDADDADDKPMSVETSTLSEYIVARATVSKCYQICRHLGLVGGASAVTPKSKKTVLVKTICRKIRNVVYLRSRLGVIMANKLLGVDKEHEARSKSRSVSPSTTKASTAKGKQKSATTRLPPVPVQKKAGTVEVKMTSGTKKVTSKKVTVNPKKKASPKKGAKKGAISPPRPRGRPPNKKASPVKKPKAASKKQPTKKPPPSKGKTAAKKAKSPAKGKKKGR